MSNDQFVELRDQLAAEPLALLGGPKAVTDDCPDLFRWPIVTQEDEDAVLEVLRARSMSGTDIAMKLEEEFGEYLGVKHALSYPNGTMSLLAAMFAVGVGRGDEIICPSITFWASAMPCFALGASVVFGDLDPETLCLDPHDLERHISPRTKAIVVVHYCGYPADMDGIMAVACKHGIKVIEDMSHAQGSLYHGAKAGTLGDVGAMSMMAGKSLAIGEAGMLVTNNDETYERAVAFSHYARHGKALTRPELVASAGIPLGGVKGRLNQTAAAMGRVQVKYYQERIEEIQAGMNRFWDLLEGTPGLRAHRPPKDSGSTMGGWYNPVGHYLPEELGGLSADKFREAVGAEGGACGRGCNFPLHLHPVLNEVDMYGDGKPTRNAFSDRDLRQPEGSLPVSEELAGRVFGIPWFKHDRAEIIAQHAAAYRKVALRAAELA